jgi:hypothetical protein
MSKGKLINPMMKLGSAANKNGKAPNKRRLEGSLSKIKDFGEIYAL